MTISELGSLGEFLASLGVLISLIYVGIQIRQNTLESKRTNARETSVHYAAALHGLSRDNEIADIFVRGIKDLSQLTDAERYRFDVSLAVWLQAIEQAFADYRMNRYTDDDLEAYRTAVANVFFTPGGEIWWSQRKNWFSPVFQTEIDTMLKTPPVGGDPYEPQPPSNKTIESDT